MEEVILGVHFQIVVGMSPNYLLDYRPQRKLEITLFSCSLKILTGMYSLC